MTATKPTSLADTALEVKLIHPSRGAKYSPNLHAWMKERERAPYRLNRVFKDAENIWWIGFWDDHYFIGCKLIGVLCNGKKQKTFAWPSLNGLVEVPDFWAQYIQDGRCAIDREHSIFFIGDDSRWQVHGESRHCIWCGHADQALRKWTESVAREDWVAA